MSKIIQAIRKKPRIEYENVVPELPLELWHKITCSAIALENWIENIKRLLCTSKMFDKLISQEARVTILSMPGNTKIDSLVITCKNIREKLSVTTSPNNRDIMWVNVMGHHEWLIHRIEYFVKSLDCSRRIILYLTPGALECIEDTRIHEGQAILYLAVDILIGEFDEETAHSAIIVKLMSETLLAYKKTV